MAQAPSVMARSKRSSERPKGGSGGSAPATKPDGDKSLTPMQMAFIREVQSIGWSFVSGNNLAAAEVLKLLDHAKLDFAASESEGKKPPPNEEEVVVKREPDLRETKKQRITYDQRTVQHWYLDQR